MLIRSTFASAMLGLLLLIVCPVASGQTPGEPTNLMVTSTSATSISLSWTAPTEDGGGAIDGYNVYRCEQGEGDACTPTWIAWVDDGTTFTDTHDDSTSHEDGGTSPITEDTNYRYAVGSSRGSDRSDWSNEVTAVAHTPQVPAAPTGLSGRADSSKVVLGWTAPVGTITSYTLYRGDGNTCDNLTSSQTGIVSDATSVEDTSVTADSTYCYAISASNDVGEGSQSGTAVLKAVTVGKPTVLTVTATSATSIGLSWTAPASDSGGSIEAYNVYRCEQGEGDACTPTWIAWVDDGTTFTDTHDDSTSHEAGGTSPITEGNTYRYDIAAYRVSGGARSDQVTALAQAPMKPAAPTGLSGRADSSKVVLGWTAPVGTITSYTLYRGDGNTCDNLTSSQTNIAASATSVEDTTVTADSTYCYAISASNDVGEGSQSGTAVLKAVMVGKPTVLTVTATSATSIGLSWTAPASDSGGSIEAYNVYRCEQGEGDACTPTWIAWVDDGTTFTDTHDDSTSHEAGGTSPITEGNTYRYDIAAYRVSGGARSDQVTALAQAPMKPAAPTGLSGRADSSKVVLGWTAPVGTITSYTLYRGDGNTCDNLTSSQTNIAASATSVEDTTVTADSTYCYAISASNDVGEGSQSGTAVLKAVMVGKPTVLTVTATSATSIGLSWTAPASDSGGSIEAYNVYRCEQGEGDACTPTWIAWVDDGTTFTDTHDDSTSHETGGTSPITEDNTYRYEVAAYRVSGGARSDQVTALAESPTFVLNLNAIADDNTVNIAEKAAGFTIGGDTGSVSEASVTVTVGSTDLTATSSTDDPAIWSVSVPGDAADIAGTSVDVAVNASKTGYTAATAVERTLTVDLTAPEAPTYTAPSSLKVGVAIAAMSPTGGTGIDGYSATGLPSGLSIGSSTGAIGGTPDTADASTASATITASDTAGNTDTVTIAFPAVAKGDQTLTGFQYSASSVTHRCDRRAIATDNTVPRRRRGSRRRHRFGERGFGDRHRRFHGRSTPRPPMHRAPDTRSTASRRSLRRTPPATPTRWTSRSRRWPRAIRR